MKNPSKFFEQQLSSEEIFQGRIVHLFRDTVLLPNGRTSVREVARHPGAVCVLPLCADGSAVMVRQFRYPYARELLEAPAGKLDPHEDPLHIGYKTLTCRTW